MDIYTAAHYLQSGYRIRRPHWGDNEYLLLSYNYTVQINTRCLHPSGPDTYEYHSWAPKVDELLASDWELITEGIGHYFPITYLSR
jgi:hypothetical protein